MAHLIDEYFSKHLNLPWEDAKRLHQEYYTSYGLAIEGLVRHHQIDPLDYNSKVDDALPLEGVILPNPELRELLDDLDRTKVTPWLFTNAYITHAKRVINLLEIGDIFEGLTFCDYSKQPLVCKPHSDMFIKGMKEAGVERTEDCFFVGRLVPSGVPPILLPIPNCVPDDSYLNCSKAQEYGWTVAHLVEEGLPVPKTQASPYQIRHLRELRTTFPQFFKSTNA
jgi:pyrimidine and pyridine-specific 5'-nucleotidase